MKWPETWDKAKSWYEVWGREGESELVGGKDMDETRVALCLIISVEDG